MTDAKPYTNDTCAKCGATLQQEPLDSFIRRLYRCPNGHVTITLVDPLRGTEEVWVVHD